MKARLNIALLFLLIAAVFGWLLRFSNTFGSQFEYGHFLHTHSHVALLGWLYNVCFIVIFGYLLRSGFDRKAHLLFLSTQITVFGMLFSFPFQGYALYSILFSTLFIFTSYALIVGIFKQTQSVKTISNAYLRWGGFYLFLSSIGPFALGYFMANGMGHTIWYKLSIYWFLHFLFNGFFLFTMLAHISKKVELEGKKNVVRNVFLLMNASVIPLFALSVLWTKPHWIFYVISFIASSTQLLAYFQLIKLRSILPVINPFIKWIFKFSVAAYLLKLIFQLLGSIPFFQLFINSTVPFTVIGFIHLVMLGFFTLFFLALFMHEKELAKNKLVLIGFCLFVLGIISSEILLFYQGLLVYFNGIMLSNYTHYLLWTSACMPLGILLIFSGQLFGKRPTNLVR